MTCVMLLQDFRCKMQRFNNRLARKTCTSGKLINCQPICCHFNAVADKLPRSLKCRFSVTNTRIGDDVLTEFSLFHSFSLHDQCPVLSALLLRIIDPQQAIATGGKCKHSWVGSHPWHPAFSSPCLLVRDSSQYQYRMPDS